MNVFHNDCSVKSSTLNVLIRADEDWLLFTGNKNILSGGLVSTYTYLGWTLIRKTRLPSEKEDPALSVGSTIIKEANVSELFRLVAWHHWDQITKG